jgi:sigma-B regulation protein RsbU (phosphoserine phosphatase)
MEPAKEVGGDFYDFFLIGENKLCFLIGDVSGKGVPAALFMVISKTLLKTEALRDSSPDEVLFKVNNLLFPDNDTCMFATVFCAILNMETGELHFANAGHDSPLLLDDGNLGFVKANKAFVLGGMENTKFVSEKLTLKPGDIFFLYTDGVTEAKNPEAQLFSDERLKQILSSLKDKDVTEIIQKVRSEVDTFAQGAPQFDDITMLALKFNSPSQKS